MEIAGFSESQGGVGQSDSVSAGPGQGLAIESRPEADAFGSPDGLALEFLRAGGLGEIKTGGHDVDQLAGLGFQLAAAGGGNSGGPMGDQRGGDASFVGPVLAPVAEASHDGLGGWPRSRRRIAPDTWRYPKLWRARASGQR